MGASFFRDKHPPREPGRPSSDSRCFDSWAFLAQLPPHPCGLVPCPLRGDSPPTCPSTTDPPTLPQGYPGPPGSAVTLLSVEKSLLGLRKWAQGHLDKEFQVLSTRAWSLRRGRCVHPALGLLTPWGDTRQQKGLSGEALTPEQRLLETRYTNKTFGR